MESQSLEQQNLRARWEQTAKAIRTLKTRERRNTLLLWAGTLLSVLLPAVFIVSTSVWFAHRIMH